MDKDALVQLRVKGRGKLGALPHGNGAPVNLRESLHARARLHDVGRADEGHGHQPDARDLALGAKASQLAAVGVALDEDVERAQTRGSAVVVARREPYSPTSSQSLRSTPAASRASRPPKTQTPDGVWSASASARPRTCSAVHPSS